MIKNEIKINKREAKIQIINKQKKLQTTKHLASQIKKLT